MKLRNMTPEYRQNNKVIVNSKSGGNPYRDMKTGQFDDTPFSKSMTSKGSNKSKVALEKSKNKPGLDGESYNEILENDEKTKQDWRDAEDVVIEADENGGSTDAQRAVLVDAEKTHTQAARKAIKAEEKIEVSDLDFVHEGDLEKEFKAAQDRNPAVTYTLQEQGYRGPSISMEGPRWAVEVATIEYTGGDVEFARELIEEY